LSNNQKTKILKPRSETKIRSRGTIQIKDWILRCSINLWTT